MYNIIENYLNAVRIEEITNKNLNYVKEKLNNTKYILTKVETNDIKDNFDIINLNLFLLDKNFNINLIYNKFYNYKKNNSLRYNYIEKKGDIYFTDDDFLNKINVDEEKIFIFIDRWNKKTFFNKLKRNFKNVIIRETHFITNFQLLVEEMKELNKLINNLQLSNFKNNKNLTQFEILEEIKNKFVFNLINNKIFIKNYRAEYINLLLLINLKRQSNLFINELININYKLLSYKEKKFLLDNFKYLGKEVFNILKSKEFYIELMNYSIRKKNFYLVKILKEKIASLFN